MDLFLSNTRQSIDAGEAPLSVAEGAYREELAFDARRSRRRKVVGVLRACVLVVMVPVVMILAFVASYSAVVIMNGGTPDELVSALMMLFERARIALSEALGASFASFGW